MDEDGWEVVAPTNKGTRQPKKPVKPKSKSKVTTPPVDEAPKTTDNNEADNNENEASDETTHIAASLQDEQQQVDTLVQEISDVVIENVEPGMEFEGDDGEWITPDNVDEFNALKLGVTPAEFRRMATMDVACMTSDFAMQVRKRQGNKEGKGSLLVTDIDLSTMM